MRTLIKSLMLCYVICWLPLLSLAQKKLAPLPVEEVLSSRSFSRRTPIDISPTGGWIAYTLKRQTAPVSMADDRYTFYSRTGVPLDAVGGSVYVTNIKSGESRRITDEQSTSWGPSWSPDGRYLAFYSDEGGQTGLYIWEVKTGSLRRASSAVTRAAFGFDLPLWTPDGAKILVKILPEGLNLDDAASLLAAAPRQLEKNKSEVTATVTVYGLPASKSQTIATPIDTIRNRYLCDLALINVKDGTIQRLVRRYNPNAYTLSPDGHYVAFANFIGTESLNSRYDVIVVPVAESVPQVVASRVMMEYGCTLSWSPDSKSLAYVTSGILAKGDCYIVQVNRGAPRNITEGTHPVFNPNQFSRVLWDNEGRRIYLIGGGDLWSVSLDSEKLTQITKGFGRDILGIVAANGIARSTDGGKSIYIGTRSRKTKQVGFYKVDSGTGQFDRLIEENKAYGAILNFSLDVSDREPQILYVAQDGRQGEDLWLADLNFGNPRRVTNINPQFEKYVMGATRIIEWNSEDGAKLQGALLLPAGYEDGKRYPVIVEVYGGELNSNFVNKFGLNSTGAGNKQLYATRGYAVFMPDMPLRIGTPMRDIAKTVLPGVDKLIEIGIADPDRLGVMGASYGGYSTLALITQTSRFKAAVSRSGFGNLFSNYGVMQANGDGFSAGIVELGQGNIGGSPWQYRDKYIENSPSFYLDRVTTPLLLIHGALDNGVPAFLSEEIFVGLRRLSKEVVYAKYQGASHTESSYNYADSLDYAHRTIQWFDERLKRTTDTASPAATEGKTELDSLKRSAKVSKDN